MWGVSVGVLGVVANEGALVWKIETFIGGEFFGDGCEFRVRGDGDGEIYCLIMCRL